MVTAPSGRGGKKASSSVAPVRVSQLSWHQIYPAPLILLSGTENFLAERAIRLLRDHLILSTPHLEISDIDAANYVPGELLALASPSLFAEPRLIRVSQVEKCTDIFLSETLDYLQHPLDDVFLVLRHSGGLRAKKLLEAFRALPQGIEVVCAELKKETEKYDFVAAECSRAERRITSAAIRALLAAFSDDLAELAASVAQLMSDTTGDITEATVDRYYSGRVETTTFQVADSAIAGHYARALGLLRHALASGADPVPLVAAFAIKLRTMAKVWGVQSSSAQVAKQLGLAPWQVERARKDARGWSSEGLGRSIQIVAETDENIKGAARDPVYALEKMIAVVSARGELR